MNACAITREDLCTRYLTAFGLPKAIIQTMEECGELTTALAHLSRERKGALDEVIEETADVAIMIDVIRAHLGDKRDSNGHTIDDIIAQKYQRMKMRVDTGNQNAGKE